MPPGKLDATIVLALGLTTACGDKEDTGPCLDFPVDTGEDTGETGPCLDYATDAAESDELRAPGQPSEPQTEDATTETREQATQRVLERGVLPQDVAKLLSKRNR